MNILFITKFYQPHVGGVEKHVALLTEELIKRGHRVRVITEQFDDTLALKETTNDVQVHRIPYPALHTKLGVWRFMREHRKQVDKADVVHVHDVYWWLYSMPIAFRKKVFITFHGYEHDPPRTQEIIQRRIINTLSAGSIGVGAFIEEAFGTKLDVIVYGAANSKPSPLPHHKKVVFIGRLEEDTGIREYLELMKLLGNDFSLDIYGHGALKNEIVQLIKDTSYRSKYCGISMNSSRVIEKAHDVFSSQYLTILEAMQTGRIVWALGDTPLKQAYLKCHPLYEAMLVGKNAEELRKTFENSKRFFQEKIFRAQVWAVTQTPALLADRYLELWKTKSL
jgi:glycosyltransferase involved in cell wall biosynthesis